MRIVAGELGGRVILAPEGLDTRPTTDRVRESLFSSLYSARGGFEGAVVLDAFAGSGALGIEALSRGAAQAVFFESDRKAHDVCRRNIEAMGLGQRARLFNRDVLQAPPVQQQPAFDLVLLDPPYAYDPDEVAGMMTALRDAGALADGGLVAYEHAKKGDPLVEEAFAKRGFELRATKKYGKTAVTFFNVRG